MKGFQDFPRIWVYCQEPNVWKDGGIPFSQKTKQAGGRGGIPKKTPHIPYRVQGAQLLARESTAFPLERRRTWEGLNASVQFKAPGETVLRKQKHGGG